MATDVNLPWATEPSGAGATLCDWCGRDIQMPALPCSVRPVDGLLRIETTPGQGPRCQYELSTRHVDVLGSGID